QFCKKYNVVNDINHISIKLADLCDLQKKEEQKLKKAKIDDMEHRRKELITVLAKLKIKIRDDSKLCSNYINGKMNEYWTLDRVVHRMCEMKYLFDYCHMRDFLREASEYRYDDNDNEYGIDSIFDIAEQKALEEYGDYPKKWPWM